MAQKLLPSKAKYCRSRQRDPRKFEKGTLRTTPVKSGVKKVTGCPKGSTYTQKKGVGCRTFSGRKVSTELQTILYKAGTKACPYPGGKELSKGFPMRKKNAPTKQLVYTESLYAQSPSRPDIKVYKFQRSRTFKPYYIILSDAGSETRDTLSEAKQYIKKVKPFLKENLRIASLRAANPVRKKKSIRRKRNRIESMTFGVMPSFKKFKKAFDYAVAEGQEYPMHLKGSLLDAADNTIFEGASPGKFDARDLYKGIQQLADKYMDLPGRRGDDAGSLASSIMETLDFEWV